VTTTLREVTTGWVSYLPAGAQNVTFDNVGNEAQIRWGVPVDSLKAGLGFGGNFPPVAELSVGVEFDLGTLRFFNYDVAGRVVTEATARLSFVFGNLVKTSLDVTFRITGDTVTVKTGFPTTISAGNTELQLLGFRATEDGEKTSHASTSLGSTGETTLVARLISTPEEEANCEPGEFDSVFNPSRCSVLDVCPISDDLIIDDCEIPEAPDPLTDCPDIDIPIGVGTPPLPASGVPGPPGPPGPPGSSGDGGCIPVITANTVIYYTQNCASQNAQIIVSTYPPCNYHITLILTLCRPYYSTNGCCVYVCCNDAWTVLEGGGNCYLHGEPTTTAQPGNPPPVIAPPDGPCANDGGTIIICPCDYLPPEPPCYSCGSGYGCNGLDGGTATIIESVSGCAGLCEYSSELVQEGDCFIAYAEDSEFCDSGIDSLSICCVDGEWQATLTCDGVAVTSTVSAEEGDEDCVFTARFITSAMSVNCCDSNGVVTVSFTARKCGDATTPAPTSDCEDPGDPDPCVVTGCDPPTFMGGLSTSGSATVSVAGHCIGVASGGELTYNENITSSDRWQTADCGIIVECTGGSWSICIRCGKDGSVTCATMLTATEEDDAVVIEAVFSAGDTGLLQCCDVGASITVTATIPKCDDPCSMTPCTWAYDDTTGEWELQSASEVCPGCFCLDSPEGGGAPGELAELPCTLI